MDPGPCFTPAARSRAAPTGSPGSSAASIHRWPRHRTENGLVRRHLGPSLILLPAAVAAAAAPPSSGGHSE